MKKAVSILLASLLLAGASALAETVTIAATSTPHGVILEHIKPLMAEKGFELNVVIFEDYIQPNEVVEQGEMEANFFQHTNYLYEFNAERGTHLVPVIPVHFEPMAAYKGKTQSLDALPDGGFPLLLFNCVPV